MNIFCRGAVLWILLALSGSILAAEPGDGRWQLRLSGHQSFVFGETGFGGGVRIPWEVVIEFQIRDGEYLIGSGRARWLDRVIALSYPSGWFSCKPVDGTYLDSNLALHETPRVRFSGFPVAGELDAGRVRLQPGYSSPGNYLAVTYECTTDNPVADNWFPLAERGKQVMGKRQDAETRRDGVRQVARVREVAALPPVSQMDLPLQADWSFAQGSDDAASFVSYQLQRLE